MIDLVDARRQLLDDPPVADGGLDIGQPFVPTQPATPVGEPAAIRPEFDRRALPQLAERVRPARDLTVELTLDGVGGVAAVDLHADGLTDALRARLVRRLQGLTFTGANVVGRRYSIAITAAELEAARPPPPPTHMGERVAYPTHPSEMIAPPHMAEAAPRPQRPDPGFDYAEMAPKPAGRDKKLAERVTAQRRLLRASP